MEIITEDSNKINNNDKENDTAFNNSEIDITNNKNESIIKNDPDILNKNCNINQIDSTNINNKICINCKSSNSKYKCPKCKCFYCSINCYKLHKISCIKKDEIIKNEEQNNNQNELKLDEEEDIILSKKELEKLKFNKSLMEKLKNKQLKQIIKSIDSAKYKRKLLQKVMDTDPDFKEFTTEILQTLGFIHDHEFTLNNK